MESKMNIATALKTEISRIARKELRGEIQTVKKSSAQHRTDIAAMKRRIFALEHLVKTLAEPSKNPVVKIEAERAPLRNRFSATGFVKRRKFLGLTASEMGRLIGVSGQSIYKWEQGKATPRNSQLAAIRASMKLGKREVAERLQQTE